MLHWFWSKEKIIIALHYVIFLSLNKILVEINFSSFLPGSLPNNVHFNSEFTFCIQNLCKITSNNPKSNFHLFGVTEMEPTYTVSARGKMLLLHDGCRYVKTTSSGSKMRWRCTYSIRHRYVCPAEAWTFERNGVERVTYDGIHHHSIKSWTSVHFAMQRNIKLNATS